MAINHSFIHICNTMCAMPIGSRTVQQRFYFKHVYGFEPNMLDVICFPRPK